MIFLRIYKIGQSIFEALKILWRISPSIFIFGAIVNIIWGGLAAPAFYLEKLIIDGIINSVGSADVSKAIFPLLILFAGRAFIELLRFVLGRISEYQRSIATRLFSAEIEVILSKKLVELDVATLEDPAFQDKFNKIQREVGSRAWNFLYPILNIANYITGFISSLMIIVFLNPVIALIVIIASIPQFFANAKFIKKGYQLSSKLSPLYRTWGWLSHYLLRSRNYLELKLLNINPYFLKKLQRIVEEVHNPRMELEKQGMLYHFIAFIPSILMLFAVNTYLAVLAIGKTITVGSVEMYMRAIFSVQNNVGGIVISILQTYESFLYIEDLLWLLSLKPKLIQKENAVVIPKIQKEIIFEDVWFSYNKNRWISKGINLKLRFNEKVAIVGENGAGKSTFIKLIARFYDPQKGRITIDGKDLKEYDIDSYRKKIGIVLQRFETYPFSARESIGYGDILRINNLDEIKEAAKQTGIDEWVEDLPLSYENPLTPDFDNGVDPSIGQWQKIAISRILFRKDAQILILDEPTSNIDPEAEEEIFKKVSDVAHDKLLIFVTQRFSTVRWADRILVVDNGQIIENGTHKELMQQNGKYARLFRLQAKGYQQ